MSRPVAYADAVFDRFVALYGAQKLATTWAGADMRRVKATWSSALSGFAAESVGAALRACEGTAAAWPPTLPEFVELCRQAAQSREQRRPALVLVHECTADPQRARQAMERIEEAVAGSRLDPMFWARCPKSVQAVRLLVRGAAADHRLAKILAAHIADGGAQCRSPEAAAAIRALPKPQPSEAEEQRAPAVQAEEVTA